MSLRLLSLSRRSLKMDMHMLLRDLSTLILESMRLSLNMVNWRELKRQRLKLNKLMNLEKKIKKILHYGRQLSLKSQFGNLLGEKEDQVGILNALLWLTVCLVAIWTSIQVESTLSFLIMRTRWLSQKPLMTTQTGSGTSFMLAIWTSTSLKCQNHLKTSWLSRMFLV